MTLLEVSNLNFYLCKERTLLLQRAVIRTVVVSTVIYCYITYCYKYVVYAINMFRTVPGTW